MYNEDRPLPAFARVTQRARRIQPVHGKPPKDCLRSYTEIPTNDIVGDAGRECDDTSCCAEEIQFRQDSAQYGEGLHLPVRLDTAFEQQQRQRNKTGTNRDGNSHTNKEQVGAERNGNKTRVVSELIVQPPSQGAAETEGQGETGKCHRGGYAPVADEEADVGLEADEEEVEDEAQVGNEGEAGDGCIGEDGLAEAGNAAHDGGTEDDSADDLCDDTGLADLGEGPVEEVAQDDDEAGLESCQLLCEYAGTAKARLRITWMMKRMMGSLGLYSVGLAPSMTPAWEGARLPSSTAFSALARRVAKVDMVAGRKGLSSAPWSRLSILDDHECSVRYCPTA